MLTPEQEFRLTRGGDSPDHYHSSDRVRVHTDIGDLDALANVRTPTSGSYTIAADDDFILANNAGPFQLPKAKDGRVIEIIMTTFTPVTINLASGDTFYGESSIVIEEKGTALRLKAITGGWLAI